MRLISTLARIFSLISLVSSRPSSTNSSPSKFTILKQFANLTSVENIATRPNGQLLVTIISPTAQLWNINPFTGTSTLITQLDDFTGLSGVDEYDNDVFVFSSGNYSGLSATPGAFALWLIDISQGLTDPKVSKITDIPEGEFLNAVRVLNERTVLISDSIVGCVFSVDIPSGKVAKAISDPTMAQPEPGTLGINGMKLWGEDLVYANSFLPGFFKIPIDQTTGKAVGPAVEIGADVADDFSFGPDGNAYLADPENTSFGVIEQVALSGYNRTVLNSSQILLPSSTIFGRTSSDKDTIYITTRELSVNSGSTGGGVVAIDFSSILYNES